MTGSALWPQVTRVGTRATSVKALGVVLALALAMVWGLVPSIAYAEPVEGDAVVTGDQATPAGPDEPADADPSVGAASPGDAPATVVEEAPRTADAPPAPPAADAPVAGLLAADAPGQDNLGLSVANGGVTTVAGYSEVISFELQINLPAGTSLKAGAVSTLTLDPSLRRTNNGALPAGATSQSWDQATRTLRVVWGPLTSGGVYGSSLNAVPSGLTETSSTLQATAVLTGTTGAGAAVTQTSASAVITPVQDGVFPAEYVPVSPGSWKLGSTPTFSVNAGQPYVDAFPSLSRLAGNTSSFRNLTVSTTWGAQNGVDPCLSAVNGTDLCLKREWVTSGPAMIEGAFASRNTIQDDSVARTYAWGAIGGNVTSGPLQVRIQVPEGAEPGVYSVPFTIYDDNGDGTKTVVVESFVRVTVKVPVASTLSYVATAGPTTVVPGETFEWGQLFSMGAPAGKVKDLTVTLKVPAGTTPRAVDASVGNQTSGRIGARSYEYTTDETVSAASAWQALPMSGSTITAPSPEQITGIRYVIGDFTAALSVNSYGGRLALETPSDAAAGTVYSPTTVSVTFTDPVGGPTTVPVTASFGKNVTVVAETGAPPRVAASDATVGNGVTSFGTTYANGNSFPARFFLGSDSDVPLKQPYMFYVVPKGMTMTQRSITACTPTGWATSDTGCGGGGVGVMYPPVSLDSGSVPLSDGSTLYYLRMTAGQILKAGNIGLQELYGEWSFSPKTMLAGEQPVLVGMGSMVQDTLTVSPSRVSKYTLTQLSDPNAYGSYVGVSSEIRSALAGLGVTTSSAMMGTRTFTVSPSTSVGSKTAIKGSEDAAEIVQGAGTATARPGGSVSYRVDVSNTGAAVYDNFQFIDVLPYADDTYMINAGTSRGSAFDTTLSGNVKVLVNGVSSAGAIVDYATTTTPERFDAAGDEVAGSAWTRYTGSASGAKALRVTMAQGVDFNPGDTITLSFDATVPASAPRDGSVANNSVAYRFQTSSGAWFASESPAVSVKSSAPTGDTALSGLAYLDLDSDAVQDADEPGLSSADVSLQLFKLVGGDPVAVGSPVSPNTDGGVEGVFSFIGIEPNLVYKVKPVSSNTNITFPAAALDADGFLVYAGVSDAAANDGQDTTQYVGTSEFRIGDQAGVAAWVKDLRLPVKTTTTVSGTVLLASTTGTPLTQGTGPYVGGFGVSLMKDSAVVASTTTDGAGVYAFTALEGLVPGDYSLTYTLPGGSALVAAPAPLNSAAVFSGGVDGSPGVYSLIGMSPGTGASGVSVYYTDVTAPVAVAPVLTGGSVVDGTQVNPTAAAFAGSDVGTSVASYAWRALAADDSEVASGTTPAAVPTAAIPASLADGQHRVVVAAVDLVGNVSSEASATFTVDRTAPAVFSVLSNASYVRGGAATPTTSAGWIALYGVTATDAGVGMPATGGITVDASAVSTAAGSYPVRFTATDRAGNATVLGKSVTYVVAYVGDPTITVGSPAVFFELGTTPPTDGELMTQLAATAAAADASASIVSLTVDSSAVVWTTAGTYPVVVTATDSLGATTTAPGTVTVRDTVAPSLSLATPEVSFAKGDTETQPTDSAGWVALFGATAEDTGSGVASISVDASAVSYAVAGVYPVVFTAADNAGLTATASGTYTVTYAGDPTIALTTPVLTYEMGAATPAASSSEWVAALGASASSAAGTTVTSLVADGSAVLWTTPGTYQVLLTATDSYGNAAHSTGTVLVQDTTAPELVLATPAVRYTEGDTQVASDDTASWVTVFGAAATDTGTGVATLVVDASAVDYAQAGAYPVVFTATDNGGLSRTKTGTYTVAFAGAPTISMTSQTLTYEMGTAVPARTSQEWVTALGATAASAAGTTVASLTADASAVDWAAVGTYQVLLTVTDSYDNTAVSFGTVVVQDTTAPEVVVAVPSAKHGGAVPETAWTTGDWLAAFSVTATDSGSGVDADAWQVVSSVVWGVAGTYRVEITAVDVAGNASAASTAELTVQPAPTAEAITVRARQDMELLIDPVGATSTDGELLPLTPADLAVPDAGGTVVLVDDKVVYTPALGYVGVEHVAVTVVDDLGQTGVVEYTVEVVAPPGLRDGEALDYVVRVDESLTLAGAATLPQLEGSAPELVGVATPEGFHGSVVVNGADVVFTTEDSTWSGSETFTFTVRDDLGQETAIEVGLTVVAPVVTTDRATGLAGVTTVDLAAADLVPGATYSVELRSTPALLGTMVADADGAGHLRALVPVGAPVAEHHVVVVNSAEKDRASVAFTVVAPADGTTPTTAHPSVAADPSSVASAGTTPTGLLSRTGMAGAVVLLAVLLLVAGITTLVVRRRIDEGRAS